MIKAIIFDFGQTLVDSADGFRAAEKEVQGRIFAQLSSISDIGTWESFLNSYRVVRKKFHDKSNFSRVALWQEIYRRCNLEPDRGLLKQWEKSYWERVKSETLVFPETKQVLRKLAAAYRLALITNTQGQKAKQKHRLSQYPELEKFFDVIIENDL